MTTATMSTYRVRQMLAERSHPAAQKIRDSLNAAREAGVLVPSVILAAESDLRKITADQYVVHPGKYALEKDGVVHFFLVGEIDTEGDWAGFEPLKEIAGPNLFPVKGRRRYEVLEAIAADPIAASARYGHLKQECGVCGLNLTKRESRERGIGPTCWKKLQARGLV